MHHSLEGETYSRLALTWVITIYRKIPNISPGLIEVRKHFLGGLYLGGGLIFGGHFVLVSEYQDLKIHRYLLLLKVRKVSL